MKRVVVSGSSGLFLTVAIGWAFSGSAHAQTDPRPREAKQKCAEGNYQEGTRILAELYAVTDDLVWVYNQGRCYQQNGRREEALNRFREYLRRATNATPADRAEVEGFIRELEAELAASLPPEPAPVPPPPPPSPSIEAVPAPPAALVTTAPPATPSPRPFYLASAGLAAGGVAALATGVVWTRKESRVDDDLQSAARAGVGSVEYERWRSKDRDGRRYRTYQIISYTAAGVLLAGSGVALYFGRRRADAGAVAGRLALRPFLPTGGAGGSLQVGF